MKKAHKTSPKLEFSHVLTMLSNRVRWQILAELLKEPGLPCMIIAKRVRATEQNTFRHLDLLREWGILEKGFGSLYKIAERFRVPDEMSVDLGVIKLRLDTVGKE